MAINNFIPEIWSAALLASLKKDLVFAARCNRDYEGEIREAGDKVRILTVGPVSVADYTKNTDMAAPQELTDASNIFYVDQAKYFNFQVDDVDIAQSKPKGVMAAAMVEASYALSNTVDVFIASKYASFTNTIGSDGSPIQVGLATGGSDKLLYNQLVDINVKLTENNVPVNGRFVVLPPWCHGLLLKDDRFTNHGTDANRMTLENGYVGRAAGLDIYISNNVQYPSSKYKIVGGHPMMWTFASQLAAIEPYRMQLRMADGVKGLLVYGAKVTRPNAGVVATFTQGTLS